jgi:hypothetical protein
VPEALPDEAPPSRRQHDVVVIGGGPTGVAAVRALVATRRIRSVTVVEPTEIGIGQAFGALCAGDPELICNSSVGVMFLAEERPDEFAQYLVDRGWPVSHDDYVPRYLFGEFCRDEYLRAVEDAARVGIAVREVRGRATRIVGSGPYTVEVDEGSHLPATEVLLCIGLDAHAVPALLRPFEGDPRLILGSYPVNKLRGLEAAGDVLVFGMRSSALDAMQTLTRDGRRVVLASRTGRLSAVRDRLSIPERNPFDRREWLSLDLDSDELDDRVAALITATLRLVGGELPLEDQVSASTDVVDRLRDELALAEAGVTRWADVTFDAISLLNEITGPLDAERRTQLMAPLMPLLTRYLTAVPPVMARRLLDSINKGLASMHSSYPTHVQLQQDGWLVTWADGSQDAFAYIVSAGGYHFPRFYADDDGSVVIGHAGNLVDRSLTAITDELRLRRPGRQDSDRIWTLGPSTNQRYPMAHIIFLAARQATWVADQIIGVSPAVADRVSPFAHRPAMS